MLWGMSTICQEEGALSGVLEAAGALGAGSVNEPLTGPKKLARDRRACRRSSMVTRRCLRRGCWTGWALR